MARTRLLTIVALTCLLMVLMANAAHAAITTTGGAVVHVSPPPSVLPETYTSNIEIRAFEEKQDFVTPLPIAVDISQPGRYARLTELTPATIAAGTCVESHLLHFDNVGTTSLASRQGSVTFDADVLGVIILDSSLNKSDVLGAVGTAYPTGAFQRGADLLGGGVTENSDLVVLSPDRRTVTVSLVVLAAIDQIRVITACEAGPPANLVLSPEAATNPVGEEHCVTATVTDQSGNPTRGVSVVFSVTGVITTNGDVVTLGAGGTDTTDTRGEATFCYTSELPGENVITAFADTNGNGVQDAGEPVDVATKTYVLPASTPGCEVTITKGGWIIAANGDKATFGGNAKVTADGEVSGQEEYQDHGPARPLNVHSLNVLAVVCSADRSEATIYGEATVDGIGPVIYRIRVRDNGEPGTNDMYGILLSNGYYSGERKLEGGNVQIR